MVAHPGTFFILICRHTILYETRKNFSLNYVEEIFFKIDLSDAYLQIPVEEECSKFFDQNPSWVVQIRSPPFGVKVAPAIFAIAYLDDISMNSQNEEQHKEHVHKVFSRI